MTDSQYRELLKKSPQTAHRAVFDEYYSYVYTIVFNKLRSCSSLEDVWFAITDKDKIIEIAEDAFDGCTQPITFHIFASAIDNPSLNRYAKKHGFRVVPMI